MNDDHATKAFNPRDASAVVLLSGGLDSAVALAIVVRELGERAATLSIDYGQRHRHELKAAEHLSRSIGAIDHRVIALDLRAIGGSALTADIDVPKRDAVGQPSVVARRVPVTYVPARNLMFLSIAVGLAEAMGAGSVYLGVNAVDYSGYPDCRPEFVRAFQRASSLGTKAGALDGDAVVIRAPLQNLSKADIIRRGAALGVDFSATHSCYDPIPSPDRADVSACGRCDSCIIRREGFAAAGISDPTRYSRV